MATSTATIRYYLKRSYVSQYKVNETIICDNVNRSVMEFSGKTFRYIGRPYYPLSDNVMKEGIRIPTDEVDKLIAKCRLLSATLSPYMRKDQFTLITPFNDAEGLNGTYQLVKPTNDIISIYWHDDMALSNWSHFYGETEIYPYDVTMSKRIANVMETYKEIFNELVEKYAHR